MFFDTFVLIKLKYLAPPINCEWNAWETTTCSESCGRGTWTKTRTKMINNEGNGGTCKGISTMEEPCNTNKCPGKLPSLNFHSKFHHMYIIFLVILMLTKIYSFCLQI